MSERIIFFLTFLGFICLGGIVLGIPVMLLWNGCLVSAMDGIHPIGFLQAVGLNILFGILIRPTFSKSENKN